MSKENIMWVYAIASSIILVQFGLPWWIERGKNKWQLSLESFTKEQTGLLHEIAGSKDRVLLVVNPAAGCGKAMEVFPSCLKAFLLRKATVEVRVTKGAEDVRSLADTNDLSSYTDIAFLSGDSTITEAIQKTFKKHGKWPYAPILHLPGGSSNVISNELFPVGTSPADIIALYSMVKKGSVLKATDRKEDENSIFALQVFLGGLGCGLIKVLESNRHGIHAVTGMLGMLPIILYNVFQMSTQYKDPAVLSLFNSQHEANGINFQFGNNRLDENMAVIRVDKFDSGFQALGLFKSMKSGQLVKDWKAGTLKKHVDTRLATTYVHEGPLELLADGSNAISLKADDGVTFEVLPKAIPFWTPA
jgi:diacylglycerol kinase family enzyme